MARSRKRLKFFVKVARPRIDTTIVEVEATDDEDAERKALEKAKRLPQAAWSTQPFDPKTYRPHVCGPKWRLGADQLVLIPRWPTRRSRTGILLVVVHGLSP